MHDVTREVKEVFSKTYQLNKLCPKCGGLLEIVNEIHCEKCKLHGDIIGYLTFIERGVMYIRNKLGLSKYQLEDLAKRDFSFLGGNPEDEV